MDPILINFMLQNIGVPVVAAIIKAHRDANGGAMPTSEQVIAHFTDDWQKWTNQGKQWLLDTANNK